MGQPALDPATMLDAVRAHGKRRALAAFATSVLEPAADQRTFARVLPEAAALAQAAGLAIEDEVRGIRPVAVLERGPESPDEWAVLLAAYLDALVPTLETGDAPAIARKLVARLDALTALGGEPYRFVAPACPDDAFQPVARAMAEAVRVDLEDGARGRGRALPRAEALAAATARLPQELRTRLARATSGTSLGALFGGASGPRGQRVAGPVVTLPRGGLRGALRVLSGIAALAALARGIGFLAGIRRVGTLDVADDDADWTVETRWAGRLVRTERMRLTGRALAADAVDERFPAATVLVSTLGLAAGVVLGGSLVGDGVRSGETYLLLLGAALVVLGVVADLVVLTRDVARGRTTLRLMLVDGRSVALRGVDPDEARDARLALARLPR